MTIEITQDIIKNLAPQQAAMAPIIQHVPPQRMIFQTEKADHNIQLSDISSRISQILAADDKSDG